MSSSSSTTVESILESYSSRIGKVFIVCKEGLRSHEGADMLFTGVTFTEVGTFVLCGVGTMDHAPISSTIGSSIGSRAVVVFKILLGSQIRYIRVHPDNFGGTNECPYFKEME